MVRFFFILLCFINNLFSASGGAGSIDLDRMVAMASAESMTKLQCEALSHPDYEASKTQLHAFRSHLFTVPQNESVHIIDSYVEKNLNTLCSIASKHCLDDGTLKKEEIQKILRGTLAENPDLYTKYEDKLVTTSMMHGYVEAVLQGLDEPVLSLYSRALTFSLRLKEEQEEAWHLQRIYDCIAENYLTGGGCYAGRRNRIFIVYTAMLTEEAFSL